MKKNLLKRIKNKIMGPLFKSKKYRLKKSIPIISKYLKNGRYVLEDDELKLTEEKGRKTPSFTIFSKEKERECKSVKIYWSKYSEKVTFLFDDVVVSKFFSFGAEMIFNHFYEYLPSLPYPYADFLVKDAKKKYIAYSRIDGKQIGLHEAETKNFLAKAILSFNLKSKVVKDFWYPLRKMEIAEKYGIKDVLSYVQHGDFYPPNIFFTAESEFKLIDYDSVALYPALLDFFRVIIEEKELLEKFLVGGYDKELKELFSALNEPFSIETKDKYFAIYLIISMPSFLKSITFPEIPKEYVLANKVLLDRAEEIKNFRERNRY